MGCCASQDASVTQGEKRKSKHEVKESREVEAEHTSPKVKLPPKKDDRPAAATNGHQNNENAGDFTPANGSSEQPAPATRAPPPPPTSRPRVVIPVDPQEEEARKRRIELMEEVSKPTIMDFGILDQDDDDPMQMNGGDAADADAVILNFNDDFDERVERGELDSGTGTGGMSRTAENQTPSEGEVDPPIDEWFRNNNLPLPVVEWYQNTTTVFITIKLGSSEDCDAGWDLDHHEVLRCILHSTDGDCFQQSMHLAGQCKDSEFVILEDGLCLKVKKEGPPCVIWTQLFKGSAATMEKITWLRRRQDQEAAALAEEEEGEEETEDEEG